MEQLSVEKVIIPVSNCIPGMILMHSVVEEDTGTVIVAKGQVLSTEIIEKLKKFNHTGVWISIKPEQAVWDIDKKTLETYRSYGVCLKSIIENINGTDELVERIDHLAEKIIFDSLEDHQLLGCVNLCQELDKDIYEHSLNVAFLSLLIGKWAGYDCRKQKDLVLSALMHDIGKLSIRSGIQHKNEECMELMEKIEYRRHTIYGYEKMLASQEVDIEVLKGILSHHERCDGSGYPLSLRESKINDFAKVIGIADTYDYLRQKYNIFAVIQTLGSSMLRKFDVNLLLQFCINIANYYVGASVLLNTGEVGEIVFIQSQALGRPIIKVNGEYINLYEKIQLEIISVF